MAQTAAAGIGSQARATAWLARGCLAFMLMLAALLLPGTSQAQPVRGDASFTDAGNYARLILKLDEDVESEVAVAGLVLIIQFKRPVMIPVDKLSDALPEYVSSARRDPDGMAIRMALSRKVSVNLMSAGERVFVDLLPDPWTGPPPGLPQEVLRELSERARVAERALRLQLAGAASKKRPPIRVRASVLPTFVRFVFEMPDGVGVSSTLNEQKLSLQFNAPLTFDLADAKLASPPNISAITQKTQGATATVDVGLIGDVDVHSFREEKNYIVDIGFQQGDKPAGLPGTTPAIPLTALPRNGQAAAVAAEPARRPEPAPRAPEPAAAQNQPAPKPEPVSTMAPASAPQPAAAQPAAKPPAPAPAKEAAAAPIAPPAKEMAAEPAKDVAAMPAKDTAIAPAKAAAMAEPAKPAGPPVAETPQPATAPNALAEVRTSSDGLRLGFAFPGPTPAALFRRGDILWLVFDSAAPVDVDRVRRDGGSIVGDISAMPLDKGQAVRIRLTRPQLASLSRYPQGWSVNFADSVQTSTQPLLATRNVGDPAKANVVVALPGAGMTHRLVDPDAGDALLVVTALPPARGFIRRQDFVDFALLESVHGVVVQPNSDEVVAKVATDQVTLSRPGGLTLSPANVGAGRAAAPVRPVFDPGEWLKFQDGGFAERLNALVDAASQATDESREAARIDLAKFYLARGLYAEAKAMLDLVIVNFKPGQEDPSVLITHAVASALMGRPDLTLKDLANPAIASNPDSQLWRALAYAGQQKWPEAREKFKNVEFAINSLPLDLQRVTLAAAMRASLEVKDFSGAASRLSELELVGILPEMMPGMLVMRGRLDESLGRDQDALQKYRQAIASPDRAAATEARLLELSLRQKHEETTAVDSLPELELLAMTWRGDGTEVRAQQMMQRIYTQLARYGESLGAARAATQLQANSEISRQAQDEASELFSQLFLTSKGDAMPPIEALALFYEHRELTPIGRRGDEMIRRLADRLVAVDLLDQASELLQYQVDRRLEGAARAQVASRLAMVYLMNRKPDRAIGALRSTRIADLAGELRQQRLLLEARAQSDTGRHDLALDIISSSPGREAIRLRSDIHWASRRWREASEQIELYLGDRWRDFTPLSSAEKSDVVRAVIGYALAEDALGLGRFREKYAPLMTGADRVAFDTASRPGAANTAEFSAIAKMAASVDTLDGFLREMKARFPDASARAPLDPKDPVSTGSLPVTAEALPAIVGKKREAAKR